MSGQGKSTSFAELQAWLDKGQPEEGIFLSVDPAEKIQQANTFHPGITSSWGVLGSREDSTGIILATGQSFYKEPLITLQGIWPLELTLHYIARESFQSGLGKHWTLSKLSRFEQRDKDGNTNFRLTLADGRKYNFTQDQESGQLVDTGELGVHVSWNDNKIFTLDYLSGEKDSYKEGRLIRKENVNGRFINFLYNDQQQLTRIENDAGYAFSFSYENSLITKIQDHGGREWRFSYDENQCLIRIFFPNNQQKSYQYLRHTETDSNSYLLTTVGSSGTDILSLEYNPQGQITSYDDGLTYQYTYNNDGSISRQNPCDNHQTYHLDHYGVIQTIQYSDRTHAYQQWDAEKRQLIQVDQTNGKETFKYDEQNRLLLHIDHQGNKTQQSFEGNNPKPITISSHRGKNHYRYDTHYNPIYSQDEKGREEFFSYDDQGNLVQQADAQGYEEFLSYNSAGLVLSIYDTDTELLQFSYDHYGRQIKTVDGEGRTTSFKYNNNDEITQSHDAIGVTHFQYSSDGLLTLLTDPANNQHHYSYNEDGQILKEETPQGIKRYTYRDGILAAVRRVDGTEKHYQYDKKRNLLLERIDGQDTRYEYNDDGQLVRVIDKHSEIEFSYTRTGQIETEIQNGITIEHAYAHNKRVHLSFLDNNIIYQRNKQGQLQSLQLDQQQSIQFDYNEQDELAQCHYPNQQIEQKEYDKAGLLTSISTANQEIYYKMDKSGLIIQKNDLCYSYDKIGQLIKAGDTQFEYDKTGNLSNNQSHYEIGTNRLLENKDYRFSYDERGNLTEKTHKATQATLRYCYDARNQLLSYQGTAITSEGIEERNISFSYDAIGRRTSKTDNGVTRHYLYDQNNLIAILDEKKQCIATIMHGEQDDYPLSITSKNGTFYYHRDHQGSIIALSDEQGKIVEYIEYDGHYGCVSKHEKNIETYNPFAYTAREYDTSDLYYYRARYYDPEIKRFITPDPTEFISGDLNYYRYVFNDPVNYTDPSGLKAKSGPCEKLRKLNILKKKILRAGKKLFKKVGKALKKRVMTTLASLAGGPTALIVGAANIAMTGWDAWKARDEIGELFDAAKEGYALVESGDFELGELAGELVDTLKAEVMGAAGAKGADSLSDKLAKACKKKKAADGKNGDKATGDGKGNKTCKKCKTKGAPVNVIYGSKILFDEAELDFSINAPMPLIWQRHYDSENPKIGLLGQGWTLLADSHLTIKPDHVLFAEPNGRDLKFDALEIGESSRWVTEQLTLSRPEAELYHLTTGDGTCLIFSPSQIANHYQLTRAEDLNGNGLRYHYNHYKQAGQEDRLTHIETDDRRIFALNYLEFKNNNKDNLRLSSIVEWVWQEGQKRTTQPNYQTLISYDYSEQGDLIEVKNQTGRITRQFEYKNHIMVVHKVPNGLESYYEYTDYSPTGKVSKNWTNTDQSWTFTYYQDHNVVQDHDGRKNIYYFDKRNYHTGTIDPLGQELKLELDKDGLPEKIINEAGQEKSYTYDPRGNAILIKDTDGTSLQVSYHDDFNLPVEISDDLGNTTTFDYDNKGNLTQETTADGATTQYEYDSRGLPITITNPNGGKNKLEYDKAGNLTKRTDCSNQSTHYEYDRNSNLIAVTDALKQATYYHYDNEYRLIKISYPDGSREQFDYNPQGQLIKYTDPKGHQTRYTLDIEGKPTKRKNALGGELKYQYDSHGRLTRLINENNAEYKFAYDPLDRLIHEQGVDGLTTGYQYDPVGNVTQKLENETGKTPRITKFLRDDAGRLEEKFISLGDQYARTRYQYDELGQLTQARNEHSRVALAYDAMGRLTSEATTTEAGEHKLNHEYDHFGNRIKTTLPDGRNLNWLYYGSGHLHQINLDNHVISDYKRDYLHREVTRTQGLLQNRTRYDPLGRILQQKAQIKSQLQQQDKDTAPHPLNSQQTAKPVSIERSYQYDKAGELTQINDSQHGTTHYQYDALGRITQTQQPRLNETFAFDPAHNLISEEQQAQGETLNDNKIYHYQDKHYQYDTFGNMTEKVIGKDNNKQTKMRFRYDAEHQMQTAEIYKNGVEQTVHYRYDPFGRRISKTDSFNTTHFIWDGNRLLTEIRGNQSTSFIYEQDGFVPVAQVDQDNQIHYYHTDHLGTPRELTNPEGEITWQAVYKTWGNTITVSYEALEPEEAPVVQPLRFQGQYFDVETGLHYNRFRYYDPDVGRFVSQDPIGLLGGDNLYQYAPNPVGWVDPYGLSCSDDAKELRKNMKSDGIAEPDYDNSAHHIVASNDTNSNMVLAREHLEKYGVAKNGSANGVFLPTSSKVKNDAGTSAISHSRVHRNKYKKMVKDRITALSSKEDIEKELKAIASELQDGTCDIF